MEDARHLKPGTLIDRRFQIGKKLGAGGYGEIYEASQLSMQRQIVLKVLRPHLAGKQKIVERFQNEARYACRLTHPNTVVYYDFGYDEDHHLLYLAMEYLKGESLSDRLGRQGILSLEETTHILEQICGSLHDAHSFGLVHRDIKPANIMLVTRAGQEDYVKVIDFGIAKALDSYDGEAKSLTATGAILGTPHYMAPEQIRGMGDLDARTDVYALGCMVYKLLTGVPPFRGQTAIEVATQHMTSPPPMIQALTQRPLPKRLEQLLQRTLSKEREERPSTAMDFYQAWSEALSTEPDTLPEALDDQPTLPYEDKKGEVALSEVAPAPPKTLSRRQSRQLGLMGLVMVGAFLSLVAVGGLFLKWTIDNTSDDARRSAQAAGNLNALDGSTEDEEECEDEPDAAQLAEAPGSDAGEVAAVEGDAPDEVAAVGEGDRGEGDLDAREKRLAAAKARRLAAQKKAGTDEDKAAPTAEKKIEPPTEVIEVAAKGESPEDKGPVDVTISVKPWGKVKVGGRTLSSPARVTLKSGAHTVFFGQRDTPHSRRITVSADRRSFLLKIPDE